MKRLTLIMALMSPLLFAAGAGAQDFIRGDFDGDGQVITNDAVVMSPFIYDTGPGPSNFCGGGPLLDITDINDNEFVTLADLILFLEFLFSPEVPSIPGPIPDCGADPTAGSGGFENTEPEYRVSLGSPVVEPPQGPNRVVRYPLVLTMPQSIIGLECYFAYAPAVLSNPSFVGNSAVSLETLIFNVAVLRLTDPSQFISAGPGTEFIGHLAFDLADGFDPPPLEWAQPLFVDHPRRATLITADFQDHHPVFELADTPLFIRGDMDGDGAIDIDDRIVFESFYFADMAPLPPLCGLLPGDTTDVNDNEFVTLADYLLINSATSGCGGVVPEPDICGVDPSEETGGFDVADPAYRITASSLSVITTNPFESDVVIELKIQTPVKVAGVELVLDLNDAALSLPAVDPVFEPAPAASPTANVISVEREEAGHNRIVVSAYTLCDFWLAELPGEWQDLGTLHLRLSGSTLTQPIDWLESGALGLIEHQTTVIDDALQDHRPVLEAGFTPFQRGNVNADATIDISDPITLFLYLFGDGTLPVCLDAADANNDAKVDIADGITILDHLFVQAGPLPDPFGTCGLDTDIELLHCTSFPACP